MTYLLSGPVQSGKTSSLLQWLAGRTDADGILTPVVKGKRVFLDIRSGEQFNMEAEAGEAAVITVGRFTFSKNNFIRAIEIIRNAPDSESWLIIDEIGPLELKGEGFHDLLLDILPNRKAPLLLVVREGLVGAVQQQFGILNAVILNPATLTAVIPPGNGHQW